MGYRTDGAWEGLPHYRSSSRHRVTIRVAKALFTLLFALFVAGGLYFGYVFVTTASSLLRGEAPEAGSGLTLPNPFRPSALGSTAGTTPSSASLPNWQGIERLNILLLGLDQREAERGMPTRADTIIILTIDPIDKTATMIHIPRDLWVVIPGHGENKINTGHFFGEIDRPGQGPALQKKTVETAFGVRMHYFARVDFRGFEKAINAIGGVTIDAPKAIKDDTYPEGDYGLRRLYFPAGLQHLNGPEALQYARSRHMDNDLGRGERQMAVVKAAKNQAMRLDIIPKLPFLLGVLHDAISSDIPAGDYLPLINLARQIDGKNVTVRAIDQTMMTDPYGDGSVLVPRWDAIQKAFAEIFTDPVLKAEGARIVVQNGTLRDGLAAMVAGSLSGRGYAVTGVAQAAKSDYTQTVILNHRGKKYTAQKLADLLKVGPGNVRSEPGQEADITIILGADAKVP